MESAEPGALAVPTAPQEAEAVSRQGMALYKKGKIAEATTCLRDAVERKPTWAQGHHNLGVVLAHQGLHADALASFENAVRLDPNFALAHQNKGNALRRLGRPADAAPCYEKALQLDPENAEACNSLGIALLDLGEHDRAAARFREALRHRPDHIEASNNLGVALAEQGQLIEAVAIYEQSLRRKPRSAETHNNLGVALAAQGKLEQAVRSYRQALRYRQGYAEAHNNMGNALRQQGKIDDAIAALKEALQLNPRYPEAHNNIGIAFVKHGRIEEACAAYQQAIRLNPEYVEAHLNLALAWLAAGDFEIGWPEYEWRFRMKDAVKRKFDRPRWDGGPLDGHTILLHAEQGLGDTLQFIRYAPLLQRQGGVVVMEAPAALVPLLRRCPGIDQLVGQGTPLPDFDVYAPLLSLPGVLRTTVDSVPCEVPYLSADPVLLDRWATELRAFPGFSIGINWQGSTRYKEDRHRSLPLKHFEALARLPGVRLFSLQKGYGAEQLPAAAGWGVVDLGSRLDEAGAFTDTAAVMKQLDLVVTSDTATAHLAGALGVPVWVALPLAADWRFLLEREDSPWYPTMRFFRQRRWGDWPEVFARIAEEVRTRLSLPAGVPTSEKPDGDQAAKLRRKGTMFCQQGRWSEAVDCLRQALQIEPGSAPVYNNLGVALARQKRLSEAIDAYRQALQLRPAYGEARQNLGEALQQQGNLQEAVQCYLEALQLKPGMPQTHNNLGVAYLALGRFEEARRHCEQAIQFDPAFGHAHRNLGDVLEKMGRPDDAVRQFEQVFASQSIPAPAALKLGQERLRQGKLSEAIAAFRLVLRQTPANADAHAHLGQAFGRQEKWTQAIDCYQEAARLRPADAEVRQNLGTALRRAGRLREAEACYREAIQLRPDAVDAYNHLGISLIEQGRPGEAETWFRRGVVRNARHPQMHNNLGVALEQQGKLEDALQEYQESIRCQPEEAETHRNLALAWLLTGNFEKGWAEYEWRWKCPSAVKRDFEQPRWDGGPLEGRTILLHAEQGLGDTLQFIRYAPLIQRRGGVVVMEAPAALVALLRRCPGIDQLVGQGTHLPDFAVHAPLLSLPALFHTTIDTIPCATPYVTAVPDLVARWGEELGGLTGFKIGIAWQGSRKYRGDRHRSIPLKHFGALARLSGVRLFSLQKGYGAEQLAAAGWDVVDLGSRLDEAGGAFLDTAAVMQHLDLVVTSDTAMAHLAGALAVPVWLALPVARDWRWMLDREDSPWYPTMRLFRQRRWGDWNEVFGRIADEVRQGARQAAVRRPLLVELSPGELLDKIAILEIKRERIHHPEKLVNVLVELGSLQAVRARLLKESDELRRLVGELKAVNERLWDVEDALRKCEQRREFGPDFVELARSVYLANDHRAALKRQVNELCGSSLVEEKSFSTDR